MDSLLQDLRYGLRTLFKKPGFTIVAVLTLALGIGVNTAIFSLINGVLLQPLPYQQAERLMIIWNDFGDTGQSLPAVSPPDYLDYRAEKQLFEDFAAATSAAVEGKANNLTDHDEPHKIEVASVTANFLPLLGVQPLHGRHFQESEAVVNGPKVAMISYRLWQNRYGGNAELVGQQVKLGGEGYTIIGILPPDFKLRLPKESFLLTDSDLWLPMQLDANQFQRNFTFLTVMGRLRANVSLDQAQAELSALAERLRSQHPIHKTSDLRIRAVPLHQDIVKTVSPVLWTLLGAVAFVLLIACGNVANLMLTRTTMREKELAIRSAMGASRLRIVRQLFTECLLLAVLGGGLGLLLAQLGLDLLQLLQPENLPRLDEVSLDRATLLFTLALTLGTIILFGLAPVWQATRQNLNEILKDGSKGSTTLGRQPLRKLLVVTEIALTLVLLIGSGLFIRSFISLTKVDPGFTADNILTLQVAASPSRYKELTSIVDFYRKLEQRVAQLPGVKTVGLTAKLPLTGIGPQLPYAYNEETAQKWESLTADWRPVNPAYFRAMGIQLMAGREFTEQDDLRHPRVLIVDETLAQRAWPGENPIGKKLQFDVFVGTTINDAKPERHWLEVVGVVKHTRNHDLTKNTREQVYSSIAQAPFNALTLAIQMEGDMNGLAKAVTASVKELDHEIPVSDIKPMSEYLNNGMAQIRFTLILIGIFGAIALVLASIGLYGTISYGVSQREQEIGIRMALGAQPKDIVRMIVGQGVTLTLIGIGIGLLASALLTRFLTGLLFGVNALDPATYFSISIFLTSVALIACYIPAQRATRIDPFQTLKK